MHAGVWAGMGCSLLRILLLSIAARVSAETKYPPAETLTHTIILINETCQKWVEEARVVCKSAISIPK
jgi:hypothetical protein